MSGTYMPGFTIELCSQLNISRDSLNLHSEDFELDLPVGHQINKAKPLIRELSTKEIKAYRARFGGVESDEKGGPEFPLDLVVGTVVAVDDHPNRDTNWVLKVRLGENIESVSKVITNLKSRPGYTVDSMMNQKVVVLNNVKRESFQGVTSEGMLMCAQDKEGIVLLTVDAADGSRVIPKGAVKKSKKGFNYKKKFKKLKMKTDENSIPRFGKLELCVGDTVVSLTAPKPNSKIV
eukprot:TRINITY_DN1877_c0_g1_i1.p1 TRINITY_DN1877_c0_g1~~TRINITY_DN1877_c0_g1_i1.p1  ORF type:complete len:235 (+),score=60.78 TRINITY_DN1877_c0_g1_i1:156-860(+)